MEDQHGKHRVCKITARGPVVLDAPVALFDPIEICDGNGKITLQMIDGEPFLVLQKFCGECQTLLPVMMLLTQDATIELLHLCDLLMDTGELLSKMQEG
jgi:hypothetical protein